MTRINWARVATIGATVATAAGALTGHMLSADQSGELIAWADAGKGALIAATSIIAAFVAALVANRRK